VASTHIEFEHGVCITRGECQGTTTQGTTTL